MLIGNRHNRMLLDIPWAKKINIYIYTFITRIFFQKKIQADPNIISVQLSQVKSDPRIKHQASRLAWLWEPPSAWKFSPKSTADSWWIATNKKNWEVLPQQKDLKKIPEEKSGRYLPIGIHGIRKNLPSNLPIEIFYHHVSRWFVVVVSSALGGAKEPRDACGKIIPAKSMWKKKFSGFGFWIRKKTSKLTKNSQRVVLDAKNTQIQENGCCFFDVFL